MSLRAGDLAQIDHDRLGQTKFRLHPSLRLLQSDYPVVSIWQANIRGDDLSSIDLSGGGEEALIIRPLLNVEIVKLPSRACDFVTALASGIALGEANIRALDGDGEFDLQLTLSGLMRARAIIGYSADV